MYHSVLYFHSNQRVFAGRLYHTTKLNHIDIIIQCTPILSKSIVTLAKPLLSDSNPLLWTEWDNLQRIFMPLAASFQGQKWQSWMKVYFKKTTKQRENLHPKIPLKHVETRKSHFLNVLFLLGVCWSRKWSVEWLVGWFHPIFTTPFFSPESGHKTSPSYRTLEKIKGGTRIPTFLVCLQVISQPKPALIHTDLFGQLPTYWLNIHTTSWPFIFICVFYI